MINTSLNIQPLLILLLKEETKILLDYQIMVHTGGRKQKGDLILVKHRLSS